jgi:polyisoprenoid-binding protein YceI
VRISGLLFAIFSISVLTVFNRFVLPHLPNTPTQSRQQWAIDPLDSRIGFVAENMGFMHVKGELLNYSAEISSATDEFEKVQLSFTAYTESLTTGNKKRDKHLKSSDFLYIEKYPEIRFVSESFERISEDTYDLKGRLTIKDSTRSVELKVREIPARTQETSSNQKFRKNLNVTGIINRHAFGLRFSGGFSDSMVGDEVEIEVDVVIYKE